jgi:hypothetical protein
MPIICVAKKAMPAPEWPTLVAEEQAPGEAAVWLVQATAHPAEEWSQGVK